MESLLYRYRNITVLLVALFGQLILLAWQVKSENEVLFMRAWAVTAVTPVASAIENARNGTTGFFGTYFALRDAREQSHKLRSEVDRLQVENQLLRNSLASAQRVESLASFQSHMPSRTIGARVIGTTIGAGTRALLIDRGTASGVRKGMAVVTADGIAGKVLAVYPFASQILTVSDPGFAAGVESQKNHIRGVLKGLGNGAAKVDYIPPGQKLEIGEMFFTSGEDRVFPRGLQVGKVTGVRDGTNFQDVYVQATSADASPEEVLIVVDPVHQEIPEAAPADTPVFLAPDVKRGAGTPAASEYAARPASPVDKMMDQYRKIGAAQNHVYGEGLPGSAPPDFNKPITGATGSTGPAKTAPSATPRPVTGASGSTGPKPAAAAGVPGTATPKPPAPKPPPPAAAPEQP